MGKSKRNREQNRREAVDRRLRNAERELAAAQRQAVDLANLDQPGVSHADQWAAFLNRPGTFYIAEFDVPVDDQPEPLGQRIRTQAVLKADDEQLLYLVEVLRQIRGAFGAERTRITLKPAQPTDGGGGLREVPVRERPATDEELAAVRAMRAGNTPWGHNDGGGSYAYREGFDQPSPEVAEWADNLDRMVDEVLEAARAGELTREELRAMLPGMTRQQVAAETGQRPEDIGGTIQHAGEQTREELAAELGVPVERLTPIRGTDGSVAYTVTPPEVEAAGRHAATAAPPVFKRGLDRPVSDEERAEAELYRTWCCGTAITKPHRPGCAYEPRADRPLDYDGPAVVMTPEEVIEQGHGEHGVHSTTITAGEGTTVRCKCGVTFTDEFVKGEPTIWAEDQHRDHREMDELGCQCPRGMGRSMARSGLNPRCPLHGDPDMPTRPIRDEPQA